LQFVTDFAVLYRSRDELVKKNGELEQQKSALEAKGSRLEVDLKAAEAARATSDLALVNSARERDGAIKELGELRKAYDLVCTSKLELAGKNRVLAEQLKAEKTQAATIKEESYNSGWAAAYDDAEVQIGYISRLNFKKGWNKALLAAGVDVDSPLYDEHDPGPKPTVDEEAPAPAIESAALPSETVQATGGIPAEEGSVAATDKGKQVETDEQPEVAN
jgi:hypothetical protein